MEFKAEVKKNGNSLTVTIPKYQADMYGIYKGDTVKVIITKE